MKNKIYSGIYKKEPGKKTSQFLMDSTMTVIENKLAVYYLWETMAHNLMLAKEKIIPKDIAKKILSNFLNLMEKAKKTQIVNPDMGDIHENVEYQLSKMMGEDAGWCHLARSRNDQATTDQKLYTKKILLDIFEKLNEIDEVLWQKSEKYKHTIMPGFTHLRMAMPSSFGFWWQAYLVQILDIQEILKSIFLITDKCPLGAGASYGVNWKINTKFTARKLSFSKPLNNALAAINSRGIDEALIISVLSVLMVVFSRMMEDLIIWSMPELNYITINEVFTTGSSIMPQKMNPDVAEKVRSKSAKLIGNLNHILIAMKGTPSGYNRDSAESKIAIVNSLDEVLQTVCISVDMLKKVIPNHQTMKEATKSSLTTKLVDSLVKKYQIPFRIAHKIVGKSIALVKGNYLKINPKIIEKGAEDIIGKKFEINKDFIDEVFNIDNAFNQYQYKGSPGPKFVSKVNIQLMQKIKYLNYWVKNKKIKFIKAQDDLYKEVNQFINS